MGKQIHLVPGTVRSKEGQPACTGRIRVIGTDLKEDDLLKIIPRIGYNNWLHIILWSEKSQYNHKRKRCEYGNTYVYRYGILRQW